MSDNNAASSSFATTFIDLTGSIDNYPLSGPTSGTWQAGADDTIRGADFANGHATAQVSLPVEVWETVIEVAALYHLIDGLKTATNTLYACALACRSWNPTSTRMLYTEAVILTDSTTLRLFTSTIQQRPYLAKFVRNMVIQNDHDDVHSLRYRHTDLRDTKIHQDGRQNADWNTVASVYPLSLAPKLPNLRYLSICTPRISEARSVVLHPRYFQTMHLFSSIRELHYVARYSHPLRDLIRLVSSFPALRHLHLGLLDGEPTINSALPLDSQLSGGRVRSALVSLRLVCGHGEGDMRFLAWLSTSSWTGTLEDIELRVIPPIRRPWVQRASLRPLGSFLSACKQLSKLQLYMNLDSDTDFDSGYMDLPDHYLLRNLSIGFDYPTKSAILPANKSMARFIQALPANVLEEMSFYLITGATWWVKPAGECGVIDTILAEKQQGIQSMLIDVDEENFPKVVARGIPITLYKNRGDSALSQTLYPASHYAMYDRINVDSSGSGYMDSRLSPCDRVFQNENNLDQHLRSSAHQPKSVKCPLCTQGFVSVSALILHCEVGACPSGVTRQDVDRYVANRDTGHIITDPRRMIQGPDGSYEPRNTRRWATERSWNGHGWECILCHREFGSLDALNRHLQSPAHADKIYRCPVVVNGCGTQFSTLSALVSHVEVGKCGVQKFHRQIGNALDGLANGFRTLTL
ncbi:hypothetical protein EIP91_012342 [Steccherinum ochraceum]|uniref:C2H2-type domain-containing protein n=1 Tax=Steccherinum ochraceum TaxID=92696 RepID=A0A4R0RGT5_9APHY|nr:hypothetical protein EIP91_012342 [Steccherinum ochraceum]